VANTLGFNTRTCQQPSYGQIDYKTSGCLDGLVVNNQANTTVQASAITRDAAFIASQARSQVPGPLSGQRVAVRVARSGLPNAAANTRADGAPDTRGQPHQALAVSEGRHGETMVVAMAAEHFGKHGCDLVWRMTDRASGREVARGKPGIVVLHYAARKPGPVPAGFPPRTPAA